VIRIVDKYPYPVEVTKHIWITMPDGYRLLAFEGEDEVFSRTWRTEIPRDGL
jgi:hypothetical protein